MTTRFILLTECFDYGEKPQQPDVKILVNIERIVTCGATRSGLTSICVCAHDAVEHPRSAHADDPIYGRGLSFFVREPIERVAALLAEAGRNA